MKKIMTRRSLVRSGLIVGTWIPVFGLLGNGAHAAALPVLDPNDPTAKALGFVTDAMKAGVAAGSTYKPGQKCGNCAQFQGKAGDAAAGCNIFAGHSVPASGWCRVWAQKSA